MKECRSRSQEQAYPTCGIFSTTIGLFFYKLKFNKIVTVAAIFKQMLNDL